MATIIKIKRGAAAAETAPSQLAAGELAVTYGDASAHNNGGDRLYIGNSAGNGNLIIGGKYFADLMDHVHGTLTASSGLIADSNSKLDNLKVDNIDLNGSAITTTNTNGDLDITPHGTGAVNFKGDGSSTPGTTVNVVNWNAPIADFEPVNLLSKVDFPTLGKPMNTTVASPVRFTSNPSDFFELFFIASDSCSRFSLAIFAFRSPI